MDFQIWLFSFVAPLFGSYPVSVLFRYCLIGSYLRGGFILAIEGFI